jgi:hypothetical protein
LPYQPNAVRAATTSASVLVVTMTNSGAASVHFGVYPNTYSTAAPQPFDVPQGTTATATFDVSAFANKYDYTCYGPDGFQRRFAGNLATDYNKIEASSILNPTNAAIAIALQNLSTSSVTFSLSNGYTAQTATYVVPAHGTTSINIGSETNNGLYDVTVTSTTDSLFVRRFLGRVQTIATSPPPAPIVLFNPNVASGKFQFNFSGPVGQSYKVLSATNVADSSVWQIASYGLFGNSSATFSETNSINTQQTRFYRMVSP